MHDPLAQFLIKPLISLHIGDWDLSFTNSSLFMVLATLITIVLYHWGLRRTAMIPSRGQALTEMLYTFVANILKENAGNDGQKYFPFIFSVFMFVLLGNLLGMLPYGFTFTSHIIVTFSLGLMVFIIVTGIGIKRHGWHFLRLFFPEGTPWVIAPILIPIEVVTYLIRPFTLAIRLFANMLAGHVLLKVFAGFTIILGAAGVVPLGINILFIGFELFVAAIQAYIFTVLTCLYLEEALHLH
jgi:F-type H+-transporting ATPase subunit a